MLTINPVVNNRNNSQMNFGYGLPKKVFWDIRDIPKMKCGCCDGDMLTSDEMKKVLSGFVAGSKRALENTALKRFEGTEAFSFIKSLSEIQPKQTIRALISQVENQVKISSLDSHARLDINHIALIADGISVKAPRVVQKLEKYREFFSKEHQEIFEIMDTYALRYPKNTFAEIFNKPEVAAYHSELLELAKKENSLHRIEVFKCLNEFGKKLPPKDSRALKQANTDTMTVLNTEFFQPHIKKELVSDIYKSFIANAESRISKKKLFAIVDKLPTESYGADGFITAAVRNKKSDLDIIKLFLDDVQATYEHYKARSKNGSDTQDNIIILCGKCNRERANLQYPFFLRFHPEMIQNLQKQFNKIMTFIKHGKLKGYDDYPIAIKQNILDGSDNLIRPKIGEYLKFRKEHAEQKLEQAQAALSKDQAAFEDASQKLSDIDAKIEEVNVVLRKLKKERRVISADYEDASNAKSRAELEVSHHENIVQNIDEKIKSDRELNESLKHKKRHLKTKGN